MKNFFMNRVFIILLFAVCFPILNYMFTGSWLPSSNVKDLWFYSGLFMVLFSVLFIEPYYTSPRNVITNTVPLLLVLLSVKEGFTHPLIWNITFFIILELLFLAIISLFLSDPERTADHWKNKVSDLLKNIVTFFGKGKILYSSIFFIFVYINISSTSEVDFNQIFGGYFIFIMILWAIIVSINPKNLHNNFSLKSNKSNQGDGIGEIFGVQSKRIFLVKLFKNRKLVKKFDIVNFIYSQDDNYFIKGIVVDVYLTNDEKWVKVLQLDRIKKDNNIVGLENNIVYKARDGELESITNELRVNDFVGTVIQGSTIGKIKFEYSKKINNLEEGDLLELFLKQGDSPKRLFYQVIGGLTQKENLGAKNENGFIEGEAIQLGEWDNERLSFQKFGWLPDINTPLFIAKTDNMEVPAYSYPDYKLGVIKNTELPSILNLDEAISHHMSILGVTGSGKSFIANEIINTLKQDTKIICIDFTGEWKTKLENYTQLNNNTLNGFFAEENNLGLVEMPTMANTVQVINSTEKTLSLIFEYAKRKYDEGDPQKICLVLEEAHTIVPEVSFLGVNNWDSKAVVNKMGQIALQGRKYGVGLLVLAQRTANVSKTILTQCNTVICLQAFDETSFNFLGNYVGKDMVQALPNLPRYHAIVTGKGVRSNVPMIIDLERK